MNVVDGGLRIEMDLVWSKLPSRLFSQWVSLKGSWLDLIFTVESLYTQLGMAFFGCVRGLIYGDAPTVTMLRNEAFLILGGAGYRFSGIATILIS